MLSKLLKNAPKQAATVPPWLIGCWKREYIFDSDGTIDEEGDGTKVVYMQGPSHFIDFRVPASITSNLDAFRNSSQSISNPYHGYSTELFSILAEQLCDSGQCIVEFKETVDDAKVRHLYKQGHNILDVTNANQVSDCFTFPIAHWKADINYQLAINYPWPGILTQHEHRRECMYEQPPNNEYLELWRYERHNHGPVICLELLKETDIDDEQIVLRNRGRMIIIGRHWMMARDRKQSASQTLQQFDADSKINDKRLQSDLQGVIKRMSNDSSSAQLLDTEYSYGVMSGDHNEEDLQCMQFEIELSSIPSYIGRHVTVFDEKNWTLANDKFLIERDPAQRVKRVWELTHCETHFENKVFVHK